MSDNSGMNPEDFPASDRPSWLLPKTKINTLTDNEGEGVQKPSVDRRQEMNPDKFPDTTVDRPQWIKPKINNLTGNHGEAIDINKPSTIGRRRVNVNHYGPSEDFGPALDIPELYIRPNNRLDPMQELSMCDVDYDGDKEIVTPSKPIRPQRVRPKHDHSERARRMRKTGRQPATEPELASTPEPDFWKHMVRDETLNSSGSPLPNIDVVPLYVASPSPTDFAFGAPSARPRTRISSHFSDLFGPRVGAARPSARMTSPYDDLSGPRVVPADRPSTRITSPYTDLFGPRVEEIHAASKREIPAHSPVPISSPEDYDAIFQEVLTASWTESKDLPSTSTDTTCQDVLDILTDQVPEPTTVCLPRDVSRACNRDEGQVFPQPPGYKDDRFMPQMSPDIKQLEQKISAKDAKDASSKSDRPKTSALRRKNKKPSPKDHIVSAPSAGKTFPKPPGYNDNRFMPQLPPDLKILEKKASADDVSSSKSSRPTTAHRRQTRKTSTKNHIVPTKPAGQAFPKPPGYNDSRFMPQLPPDLKILEKNMSSEDASSNKSSRPLTSKRRQNRKTTTKNHIVPSPGQAFPKPKGYSEERFMPQLPPDLKILEKKISNKDTSSKPIRPTTAALHPKPRKKSSKYVVPLSLDKQKFQKPPAECSDNRFIHQLPPDNWKNLEQEIKNPRDTPFPDMPKIDGYVKPLGSAISSLPPIRDGTPVVNQQLDVINEAPLLPHPPRQPKPPSSGAAIGQRFAGNVRRGRYKLATANKYLQ